MNLQALLVSSDDSAAEVLSRVLSGFAIALDRSSNLEAALARVEQQKFEMLLLDFDESEMAQSVLQHAKRLGSGSPPLTIALLSNPAMVREILSGGAHFVLHKPISEDQARAGLKPAAALLSRERRRAFRVPVQAPVELTLPNGRKLEGILLDLSETGMDVLTAEPQFPGALLAFQFSLPDGALAISAQGQVAWADSNGQTGVRFVEVPEAVSAELKRWVKAAASSTEDADPNEVVPHCKLTDLSLGGCYIETNAPFPELSLVDLGLKTQDMEVHTDGMVRVVHPGYGMGLEFPSRTAEQRAQVENLINCLRSCPQTMLEMNVSPRALVADLSQFKPEGTPQSAIEEMEDPLLELLRRGASLQQDEFLEELHRQRNPEDVAAN
ncbi:MAG TPA: PilZ domain-containing protein [Candidatus Sulfotelmatobacter sp.]|nr:PilZ domain-containing protein [Candidatus Sulfotelmatobacter sp.]